MFHELTEEEEADVAGYTGLEIPVVAEETPCAVLGVGASGCVFLSGDRMHVVKLVFPFNKLGDLAKADLDAVFTSAHDAAKAEAEEHAAFLALGGADIPCVPKYVEAGTIDMTAIPKHEYYGCVTRAEARAAIDSLWDSGVTLPSVR